MLNSFIDYIQQHDEAFIGVVAVLLNIVLYFRSLQNDKKRDREAKEEKRIREEQDLQRFVIQNYLFLDKEYRDRFTELRSHPSEYDVIKHQSFQEAKKQSRVKKENETEADFLKRKSDFEEVSGYIYSIFSIINNVFFYYRKSNLPIDYEWKKSINYVFTKKLFVSAFDDNFDIFSNETLLALSEVVPYEKDNILAKIKEREKLEQGHSEKCLHRHKMHEICLIKDISPLDQVKKKGKSK